VYEALTASALVYETLRCLVYEALTASALVYETLTASALVYEASRCFWTAVAARHLKASLAP
jgi:hypothetical protein